MSTVLTRRDFTIRVAALGTSLGCAYIPVAARDVDEISRTAESIHQEVVIKAAAKRVYEALTDAKQFTRMTTFSPVMNAAPAQIDRAVGGSFALFGGHIIGRHVELLPFQRIVQAWRVVDWAPGVYSIAKFELTDREGRTTIVFEHTGFPSGKADHLAEGWHLNYWTPLEKYLG